MQEPLDTSLCSSAVPATQPEPVLCNQFYRGEAVQRGNSIESHSPAEMLCSAQADSNTAILAEFSL